MNKIERYSRIRLLLWTNRQLYLIFNTDCESTQASDLEIVQKRIPEE